MRNKLILQITVILLSANLYSNVNCNNKFISLIEDYSSFINNNHYKNSLLTLTATISANSICSGNSGIVTFNGTPNAIVTFSVDGGFNQTITLNSSGSFVLTTPPLTSNSTYTLVSISDGVSSAPLTSSATVVVNSIPNILGTIPTTVICNGETTNIVLMASLPSTTFIWNVISNNVIGATSGSGNIIEQSLFLANPASNGYVTYIVTPFNNGCSGSSVSIDVVILPTPNTGVSGEIFVSESSTSQIDLFSIITGEQPGGDWTRTSGTGGTFDAITGTFTPEVGATDSTFDYEMINGNGCYNYSTATINIDIVPIGSSNTTNQIINNNEISNIILSSNNAPSSNFTWTFTASNVNGASNGSGNLINQQLSLINANINGYVDYIITPINNTATGNQFTARVNVLSPLSSESFNGNISILYPNPVKNYLTIENNHQIKSIKIYNQLGQKILAKEINNEKTELDLSFIIPGIYTIQIETENKSINEIFIKE